MAKSKKKEKIMLAAAKLFRDRGYTATSMRDLADAVELKASSLYNHIGSKEEILKEICLENADKFTLGMEAVHTEYGDPLEKVKALVRLHVDIAIQDYTSVISFNDEWRHLNEPSLSIFKEKRRDYELQFVKIIQQGIDQGLLKKADSKISLYIILSSTRWLYDANSFDNIAQRKEEIVDLIVSGIKA